MLISKGMEFKASNGDADQVCVCSKGSMYGNCVTEWIYVFVLKLDVILSVF
jgi:hypothetical protein